MTLYCPSAGIYAILADDSITVVIDGKSLYFPDKFRSSVQRDRVEYGKDCVIAVADLMSDLRDIASNSREEYLGVKYRLPSERQEMSAWYEEVSQKLEYMFQYFDLEDDRFDGTGDYDAWGYEKRLLDYNIPESFKYTYPFAEEA